MIIITREVLKPAQYFQAPDTHMERSYIRRKRNLSFIGWALWRSVIVEMAKLFSNSNSQKHNMYKLLQMLGTNGEFRSLMLDGTLHGEWQARMDSYADRIAEISRLRNSFYAHTDGDPFETVDSDLTPGHFAEMLDFAMEVVSTLSVIYFKESLIGLHSRWNNETFPFIYILADLETKEHLQLAKENAMSYKDLTGEDLPEGYTE